MGRPRINPLTIDKTCPTCKKTFTIKHVLRNKRRFCSRKCANLDPEVLEKIKNGQIKTFNEKYGGHPMKTKNTVDNFKKSLFKNHGVDFYSNYLVKKTKETLKERYGNENYNNREKYKQTCLEKYNKDNFVKTEQYKIQAKETCLEKYGVGHSSKSEQYKLSHYKNMFHKFETDEDFKNFEPQFTIDEYKGVTNGIEKYTFKCKRCNNVELHKIADGFFPVCINCDKLKSSLLQKEIYDFIKIILGNDEIVIMNDRSIINPKELDIYIPSKKLAIEFDSLIWHSEFIGNKNRYYHLNKTKSCIFKGIRLIHIFENEWNFKKEIVKSILKSILNCNNTVNNNIYARNCEFKEIIDIQEKDKFLEENHLQGKDKSMLKYGLYYNQELISIMTFSKSRFDKKYEYEISRFCNKLNMNVVGGASKLFSYFINTIHPKSITTYSDRRYFNGNLYNKLGFTFSNITPPNYYYILDKFKNLKNRMSFQKHKLKNMLPIFDENLSEWENMRNNGFDRVWDCGNDKWIMNCNYPT